MFLEVTPHPSSEDSLSLHWQLFDYFYDSPIFVSAIEKIENIDIKISDANITNSMEQSPSWKANSHSAGQEISRLSWNPKARYNIYNSLSVGHICFCDVQTDCLPTTSNSNESYVSASCYTIKFGEILVDHNTIWRPDALFNPRVVH
jgi:hypothetical protein